MQGLTSLCCPELLAVRCFMITSFSTLHLNRKRKGHWVLPFAFLFLAKTNSNPPLFYVLPPEALGSTGRPTASITTFHAKASEGGGQRCAGTVRPGLATARRCSQRGRARGSAHSQAVDIIINLLLTLGSTCRTLGGFGHKLTTSPRGKTAQWMPVLLAQEDLVTSQLQWQSPVHWH